MSDHDEQDSSNEEQGMTAAQRYLASGRKGKTGTAADNIDSDYGLDPGKLYDKATGRSTSEGGSRSVGRIVSGADSNRQRRVEESAQRSSSEAVGTPKAVEKAWTEVAKAHQAARDAQRAWLRAQGAAARAEKAAHDRLAAEVERTGKAPAEPVGREDSAKFERELSDAHATWVGLSARVHTARAAYDALVAEHAPAWASSLLEQVQPGRQQAVKALQEAQAAVATLTGVVAAARHFQATAINARDIEGSRLIQPFDVHKLTAALEQALGQIEGEEPWLLVDVPVNGLSLTDRKQIAEERGRGTMESARGEWLAGIEASEGYTVTRNGVPVTKSA